MDAIRLLRDDAARWNDPAWQSTMRDRLAAEGIAFVLYDGEREIYRSTADPIGGRSVSLADGAADRRYRREWHAQTALIYSDTQPTVDGDHWVIPLRRPRSRSC